MGRANKDRLTRYLLGDLSEADRDQLEKEYLARDDVWEELGEAENDLIDSYVRGDLSAKQRQQFEESFLDSPDKSERLEASMFLMDPAVRQKIAATPMKKQDVSLPGGAHFFLPSRKLRLPLMVATCALAAGILITALLIQNRQRQAEVAKMRSDQTELQRRVDQLQQQIAAAHIAPDNEQGSSPADTPPTESPRQVSILLRPGILRQGGGTDNSLLELPRGTSSVVLLLDLRKDLHSTYEAAVETVDGETVRRLSKLHSKSSRNGSKVIAVRLPSQALKKGDYIVTLSGRDAGSEIQMVDSYSFSVK